MSQQIKERNGFVLIVVLWIIIILTMMVVGLGQVVAYEITATSYTVAKLKARYNAWAGFMYVVAQLADVQKSPKEKIILSVTENLPWDAGSVQIEFVSEDARLNLNALTHENYMVLANLITALGYDEKTAMTIACSALDWTDEDKEVQLPLGAEDDFYQSLSQNYLAKNAPFISIEELSFVRGVTPEIFAKLRPFITVFPRQGRLLVDLERSSKEVLLAITQYFAGAKSNTTIDDAKSLVAKIIDARREDESIIDEAKLALNAKEAVILAQLRNARVVSPRFWRIHVTAQDKEKVAQANLETVVLADDLSVLYWHRE